MNHPRRILCVEDNPVNWRLVQRLLGQAGYEMHWAEEGLKGFEMAMNLKPDLVLLDINLPGLSGFEVATKFKQTPELLDIPLIALTAKTLKSDRDTALVAGCDGFIPKPIDPFAFVKQVEAYLAGQRERVDKSREEIVLRQFNAQMLAHLESQLREAQNANRKLLDAQHELQARNRSLSRLLAASQDIFAERDPKALLLRALEQVRIELCTQALTAYRIHHSGVYWEGLTWNGTEFVDAPILPRDHAFLVRAATVVGTEPLAGDSLKNTRLWEEGIRLGFWASSACSSLILLRDREDARELVGFLAFSRSESFQPFELEIMSLHAGMAKVSLENAELIRSLDESSRALAASYDRLESGYQELQNVRDDLSRRNRQDLLEDLFVKITHRLENPVTILNAESRRLEGTLQGEELQSMTLIRKAAAKIDGLHKSLLRRAGRGETTPEWIDLHDLIQQEAELLQAEGAIPAEVEIRLDLEASTGVIYGIYSDFARLFQQMIQHSLSGPTPSGWLRVHSWGDRSQFHLEVADEGGPIPPTELERAFEPFSELHHVQVIGVRSPGQGLANCKQILSAYFGEIEIRNEGEGTAAVVHLPLA